MFRKQLFSTVTVFLIAFCSMFISVGCENKDEENNNYRIVTAATEGMYILCQGDLATNNDGSITRINPKDWSVSQIKTNLGGYPRDVVINDNYLVVNAPDVNQIEFIDRKSLQSVRVINTKSLWDEKGAGPRRLLLNGQSLYVSFDAGYVGELNMGSFSAEGIEKVGSYPEGMLYNRGVMVANSDRGMGNASIENVSMKYTPWKSATSDLLICPIDIFYAGGKLCCLDKGTFDENGNQVHAGIRKISMDEIVNMIDATLYARGNGNYFYVANAPLTNPATPVTFGIYNIDTGTSEMFGADGLENPSAMGVDYLNGYVYVACKGKDGNSGYVIIYTLDGQFVKKLGTGKNPIAIVVGWGEE